MEQLHNRVIMKVKAFKLFSYNNIKPLIWAVNSRTPPKFCHILILFIGGSIMSVVLSGKKSRVLLYTVTVLYSPSSSEPFTGLLFFSSCICSSILHWYDGLSRHLRLTTLLTTYGTTAPTIIYAGPTIHGPPKPCSWYLMYLTLLFWRKNKKYSFFF